VQFISTSDIVVHTLDVLEKAFINIFSCKTFDKGIAAEFTKEYFDAKECKIRFLERA
jgi:S-adenosylmethionine/arginine decarboxylase-like enzyme